MSGILYNFVMIAMIMLSFVSTALTGVAVGPSSDQPGVADTHEMDDKSLEDPLTGVDSGANMDQPRVSGVDGGANMDQPRVSGDDGGAIMDQPRVSGVDGGANMDKPRVSGTHEMDDKSFQYSFTGVGGGANWNRPRVADLTCHAGGAGRIRLRVAGSASECYRCYIYYKCLLEQRERIMKK